MMEVGSLVGKIMLRVGDVVIMEVALRVGGEVDDSLTAFVEFDDEIGVV